MDNFTLSACTIPPLLYCGVMETNTKGNLHMKTKHINTDELVSALESLRDEFRLKVDNCNVNTAWLAACAAIAKARREA